MVVSDTLQCVLQDSTSAGAGRLTGPDGNEMDTETFLASLRITTDKEIKTSVANGDKVIIPEGGSIPFRLVAQKYGRGIVDYGRYL